ncbi:MAG: 5-methyltetrahydropteroyltriglutamate--homocysteine S-methyltransferase [Candidatus Caenarcaniphilales bacterium]|nr:5-methyltetrahydropteroyltriglutamate--homocysteine S-methyltransferase [Candidatus Caenarcaniphilales bacterium]
MPSSNILGFPRIGLQREFKFATEAFWKGEINELELEQKLADLRLANWKIQKEAKIDLIPSNDFSYYDQMLDQICLLGAIPERYRGIESHLKRYYAMARGDQSLNLTAMEMTKWFNTNYHYLVPEFVPDMQFKLSSEKPFQEFKQAKLAGILTKPVLIGPVTFLSLGKSKRPDFNPFNLLPQLCEVYAEILNQLAADGAIYIQLDEPCLACDLSDEQKKAYADFQGLIMSKLSPGFSAKILLTTYFDDISDNFPLIRDGGLWDCLHIDLVSSPKQLKSVLEVFPHGKSLSLGLIDGRNIWKADLESAEALARKALYKIGSEHIMIGSSCSLMHVPVDLKPEMKLDPQLKDWLSFAIQKVHEVETLTESMIGNNCEEVEVALKANQDSLQRRKTSTLVNKPQVVARLDALKAADLRRLEPFKDRIARQITEFKLPSFPTTTIGSFPQTKEVRQARASFLKGELSESDYRKFIMDGIKQAIQWQEEVGIDVLVHGEFERNDMVEYFGQFLSGFTTTLNGWVQSYGTRCVKPPIIYGDIARLRPMTVDEIKYAQSLSAKPVKGMLTGPVTILQWSFVRDDQPRSTTARQIALAILDEVLDLEKAGIRIIQIDEPAFREGLPLREKDRAEYLEWASEAFRISHALVKPETQIHTHMCYSEFNDIIEAIAQMDADVITIETSRSQMELLGAFENFHYPNQIGPGVYDIHSPRVPSTAEMVELLEKAARVLPKENLWVNPDCGLKTRDWEEVKPALTNMVKAAKVMRGE